jgi:hypothetical protein
LTAAVGSSPFQFLCIHHPFHGCCCKYPMGQRKVSLSQLIVPDIFDQVPPVSLRQQGRIGLTSSSKLRLDNYFDWSVYFFSIVIE